MKRSQENQITKDDYEKNGSESDGDGDKGSSHALEQGFSRATDVELAGRRIVKAKRPARSGGSVESSTSADNPFASLGFPPSSNASTSSGGSANPFGAIKLTTPASVPVSIPIKIVNSVSSSAPSTKVVVQSSESSSKIKPSNSVNTSGGQSQFDAKTSKLNSSFLSWMGTHFAEQPLSIWKDACKDYIKYSTDLAEKFSSHENTTVINGPSQSFQQSMAASANSSKVEVKQPGENVSTNIVAPKSNSFSLPTSSQFNSSNIAITSNSMPALKFSSSMTTESEKSVPVTTNNKLPSFSFSTSEASDASKLPPFALPSFGNNLNTSAPQNSSAAGVPNFFSLKPLNGASDAPKPAFGTFGGFSMPQTNPVGIAFGGPMATSVTAAVGADEDAGDEGEPILAPEIALRNENDLDEVIHEMTCKIMRFVPPKEWKDMGKGVFKITKHSQTGKWRMVMRSLTGKVMFNAAFHKGIKFEGVNNTVKFAGYVFNEENKMELRVFALQMKKDPALLATTLAKLNEGAKASSQ